MSDQIQTLTSRREFLFLYDIKMGNPNGDPDENRPRVLPDGTHYVTDVRLKRFVRDYLKMQGQEILVDTIEDKTTNLTGRVAAHLEAHKLKQCEGRELVDILLGAFIDARLFGSSFAFKKQDKWEPKPEPKTLTGAVQINHGEVLHEAEEVDIHGTSVFGSAEEKSQGTFTTYFGLRYALMGFNGVANEHSAKLSRLTDDDYATLLKAMWNGVRSAGNTRTKYGQNPRLLVSVAYKPGEEFQFGNLADYVSLAPTTGKPEKQWASPDDYQVDLSKLAERIGQQAAKIAAVEYCVSPDLQLAPSLSDMDLADVEKKNLDFDGYSA
ncbi:MAG: type I-B CRISPR-associated protein Cas7/Csh2 [Armatimonadetes bacterium CG_4_10_14_3_um_filter_66_18]|nr:type I-B CRISPR-associated protein Cas7/Csh2 [Armatimonadota bacterium]OIP11586.1 MAG: type I-B CRISPR-associated protein Cas7/Csh2 [Armatimonadetes bacterium CG2_30_66_41]PIU94737.1 MAG: type I-B CRISPR-associated protein Cas7/Csh2 [Armatimonadetes bacterium CG06_land_8_20_14_3_00_66_21]PIW13070.1 MAG: type I-B CRISPR-associated protein Cas7/Csh2 [Armatimonadetes bacterium CG17_big_fil_post_rev_8_21_14_2_50_66_6]PIX48509.1 MAG: type I-B CRISPR-associated protein Cas7/Csh2 [Armatimonadetes b